MADKAAKLASSRPTPHSAPITFIPHCAYKRAIRDASYKAWSRRWSLSTTSQSKIWFPEPAPHKARKLLTQPRHIFSRAVRFLTGHCFLRHQRALVNKVQINAIAPINAPNTHAISPSSSEASDFLASSPASGSLAHSPALTPPPSPDTPTSVGSLEAVRNLNPAVVCRLCHRHKERAVEVITVCEFLWDTRLRAFGVFTLSAIAPQWSPVELLRFLADPRVSGLEEDES